jgi:hypothetical protein
VKQNLGYLILDTNLFYGRFDLMSNEIALLLTRTQQIGWKVCVPRAVYVEVMASMKSKIPKLKSNLRINLNDARCLGVEIDEPKIIESEMLNCYKHSFEDFMKKNNIEIIEFPKNIPSQVDLFQLAVDKMPPFDSEGQSYRDVVIWYSIEEFSKQHSGIEVCFVTKDKSFINRSLELGKKLGNVKCLSMDVVDVELQKHLDEQQKQRIASLTGKIQQEIEAKYREKISALILEIIDVPVDWGETLDKKNSFEVATCEIESIFENPPTVNFLLKISGKINYSVKKNTGFFYLNDGLSAAYASPFYPPASSFIDLSTSAWAPLGLGNYTEWKKLNDSSISSKSFVIGKTGAEMKTNRDLNLLLFIHSVCQIDDHDKIGNIEFVDFRLEP